MIVNFLNTSTCLPKEPNLAFKNSFHGFGFESKERSIPWFSFCVSSNKKYQLKFTPQIQDYKTKHHIGTYQILKLI